MGTIAADNNPYAILTNDKSTTTLSGTKVWSDNGDGTCSYSYSNLPKYEADGTAISYYVTEVPVAGYATTYSGDGKAADGGTITNTLTEVPTAPTMTTTTTRESRVTVAKGFPRRATPWDGRRGYLYMPGPSGSDSRRALSHAACRGFVRIVSPPIAHMNEETGYHISCKPGNI